MATVRNARDLALQATVPRMVPYTIDPDTVPGLKSMNLTADSLTFKIPISGPVTPANITITANLRGLTGTPTITVTDGTAIITGTGLTRNLAYTDMTTDSVEITGSIVSGADTFTHKIRISKVRDGATGGAGSPGTSNHRAYRAYPAGSAPPTPGSTSSGAAPSGWSLTPVTVSTGEAQFQTDGTTPTGSTTTSWSTPYLSYFKVDRLESIVAYTGNLIVDAAGSIYSMGKSTYASTTAGFWVGNDGGQYKMAMGDGTYFFKWTGSTMNVRSNGSAIFEGSSAAPSGLFTAALVGAGTGSLGGLVGEGSTTNSSAIGVTAYAYNGVYGQAANAGGVGVNAINNQAGGVGLRVVGKFNWGGTVWDPPHVSPVFNQGTYFWCADGTWKEAGLSFTPVQQGGGASQLTNKVHIGWSAAAKLRLQIDATDFGSTWPISISGDSNYAANAGNAYTLEGASLAGISSAVGSAIANNNDTYVYPNFIGVSRTFTLVFGGTAYPGCYAYY